MVAPTFIREQETAWTAQIGATKTTASVAAIAGDLLVAVMMAEQASFVTSLTASGGSLTWTQRLTVGSGSQAILTISTAVVDTNKTMGVTVTKVGGSTNTAFGVNCLTFRGQDASPIGSAPTTSNASGIPAVSITTTQANSVIVVAISDTAAVNGATRAWLTNAGTLTEQTYDQEIALATFYAGFHADAGAIGTYSVGLSTPGAQNYVMGALEVKGPASAGTFAPPPFQRAWRLRKRRRYA